MKIFAAFTLGISAGALLIGAGMAAAGAPGAGQFLTLGAACAVCGALLWRA